jgi:hypothetical protein
VSAAPLGPLRGLWFRLLFAGRALSFAGTALAVVAALFAVLERGGRRPR